MNYLTLKVGLLALFALLLFSCRQNSKRTAILHTGLTDSIPISKRISAGALNMNHFLDSSSISVDGKRFLVSVEKSALSATAVEGAKVSVSLYEKNKGNWIMRSQYPGVELMTDFFETFFQDMNGDGVNDLLLSIGTGARGGNEFFVIFFTDTKKRQFTKARGADAVVNPHYDSATNTIFSMTMNGAGSFFSFFRLIDNDSLVLQQTAKLWVENGITYQRKVKYGEYGKALAELTDSIADGGERQFSPW